MPRSPFLLRPLRRFFLRHIAVKLALVICLLVLLLLSALGLTLTQITERVLKTTVQENHKEIAVQVADEVSLFIHRPAELLQMAGKFIGRTHTIPWDQATVLVELSIDFPMFEEIVSVNRHGVETASSNPGKPHKDWSRQTVFEKAIQGETYFSPIRIADNYLPHVTIGIPYHQLGKVAGVLIAEVNLRGMWDIVDGIRIGDTGRVFLVASDGLLIAHPDKKLVLQNTNFSRYVKAEDISSGEIDHTLVSQAPVAGPIPLKILIQMEASEAYRLLDQMRILIWLLLLASLGISAAVSFFLAKWLVRPVRSLERWSKRVARGDFDFWIPARATDELGRLFIMFKRMSARLKQAREKERLAALGEAATAISHKLKNAIVSLKTFAQLFPQRKHDENFIQRFEKDFSSNIEYFEKIFNDLSQVASLREPKMEPVSLEKLFQQIQNSYSETVMRLGIRFQVDGLPDLPMLQADRDQIYELFVNLIQNSIQSMPKGGNLSIRTIYEAPSSFVQVLVADSGVGIAHQNMEQIFKPFFTTKHGGMGLGLSVCKRIVESHNGVISVTSREGNGSVFSVTLPVGKRKKVDIQKPVQEISA